MKSMRKPFGVLLAAAVFTGLALRAEDASTNSKTSVAPAAPAAATTDPKLADAFPDETIAKGKGFEIKRSDLDEGVSGIRARIKAQGRELMPSDLPMVERSAFDQLLQMHVLQLAATDADKVKARELADKRLAAMKKRAPDEEAFVNRLKATGMTIDKLKARLFEVAVFEQVLRDQVTVTDEQVKKYFADNPAQFEEPETVTASHILITTLDKSGTPLPEAEQKQKRKVAEGLLKRAQDGEDFTKLAKEYSDDPGVKENDGSYTFHKHEMVPEFEAAAFSMKTNQISDLVTTHFGFHVIKVTAKTPAKKMEFDKIAPDLKTGLESQEMEKVLPAVYAKLKKDAHVEILDKQLQALEEMPDPSADTAPPSAVPAPK